MYRKMQEDVAKIMCLDEMGYPFLKREWIDNEIGIYRNYFISAQIICITISNEVTLVF